MSGELPVPGRSPNRAIRHRHSPGRSRAGSDAPSGAQTQYTLTACVRCRERKSRCDAHLPRCTACEKANHECRYWDAAKNVVLPRAYIVQLQSQVKQLEAELAALNVQDDPEPDPELMVREAAVVEFRGTSEKKFLGPASGTTMTRLVMRLAKEVQGVNSILEIISKDKVQQAGDRAAQEEEKPVSKIDPDPETSQRMDYPLVSHCAATALPRWELTHLLLELYNVKVQAMYPVFHEPTLFGLFEQVYAESTDPYANFVVRMVIAIGLQRLATRYAGLADSFYLAALSYFETVVRTMTLQTLQCIVLVGDYSVLTPTRTAAFYLVGLAVRLAQALGITEERTITLNKDGSTADVLEVDIRRRVYWAVVTMDYGLAHALGRPAIMALDRDKLDVDWFSCVEDRYITPSGILTDQISTRKWVSIHFCRMRLLQLDIRRALYLKKRPSPASDSDPWFEQMHEKLKAWKNMSPTDDGGTGLSDTWFTGRYNTMIVFLFRPSPQVPRPSARAALLCYEACDFNITMQREQIRTRSVELTWAFTQSIFMAVNTILWCLSYAPVREKYPRDAVKAQLDVALEAIKLAAERWPGVSSAYQLYESLIGAILPIYDREGDVHIRPSPSLASENLTNGEPASLSQTTSPAFAHAELPLASLTRQPIAFGSRHQSMPSTTSLSSQFQSTTTPTRSFTSPSVHASGAMPMPSSYATGPSISAAMLPESQYMLPSTIPDLGDWNFTPSTAAPGAETIEYAQGLDPLMYMGPQQNGSYDSGWDNLGRNEDWSNWGNLTEGLNQDQQHELMHSLETSNVNSTIANMIQQTNAFYGVPLPHG